MRTEPACRILFPSRCTYIFRNFSYWCALAPFGGIGRKSFVLLPASNLVKYHRVCVYGIASAFRAYFKAGIRPRFNGNPIRKQ